MSGRRGAGPDPAERPVFRPDAAREVEDELSFHIEMRTRELVAKGRTESEARAEVLRGFGDLERVRRECAMLGRGRTRRARWAAALAGVAGDARFALRQLRAAPGFALAAGLTLAIGIGATTAIFSVVNAVLLEPFGFPEPERVVAVGETYRGGGLGSVSAGNFVDWQESGRSFEHIAAMRWTSFNLATEAAPERVSGLLATAAYFDVFGVPPLLGRTFRPEEDAPGANRVVLLSHGLWAERFDGDPGVVGRSIRLNGEPHTVIGVMPEGFDPYANGERLWVPIAFTAEQRQLHDDHYLTVAGRLAPGVTVGQAQSEMETIAARLRERHPDENAERSAAVRPLGESVVNGGLRAGLWVLLGAVGLVLLIACGNVANLLLARSAARARELSLRAAVGAGRLRLVRQLLTECLVLSLVAAIAGVALAHAGVRALVAAAPAGVPRLDSATVDGRVLLFALVVSVVSGLVFGLAPMFRIARHDLVGALREGGRGTVGGRDRLRGAFVAAEVALAFTLLAAAGLLIRSTVLLGRADAGFEPAGVLSGRVSLAAGTEGDPDAVRRTFQALADRLSDSPVLAASALSSQVPAGPGGGSNGLLPEGRPMAEGQTIVSRLRIITPDYFATLGIPLLEGRIFDARDVAGGERVMIISRRVAEEGWPGESAVGRRMICCEGSPDDPRWKTIVGVVGDVAWRGPGADYQPEFYLPLSQAPTRAFGWIQSTMTIVARGRGSAVAPVADAMRSALRAVSPEIPLFDVRTMEERLRGTYATNRFAAQLLGVLGTVGLLLAVIGTYGVVAYHASQRTHEIGLRMALGASTRDVLALVTRQGMRPVLGGLVAGVAGALATTRLIRGGLYGVTPTDPMTYAAVAVLLALAGILAAFLPARRATRVDPGRVLTHG